MTLQGAVVTERGRLGQLTHETRQRALGGIKRLLRRINRCRLLGMGAKRAPALVFGTGQPRSPHTRAPGAGRHIRFGLCIDELLLGYGNDSCEIGPLAHLSFLEPHSNAKKQLAYLRPNMVPPSEMLRGCSVAIASFCFQVGDIHHSIVRSHQHLPCAIAYGPKMHESLPYPRTPSITNLPSAHPNGHATPANSGRKYTKKLTSTHNSVSGRQPCRKAARSGGNGPCSR